MKLTLPPLHSRFFADQKGQVLPWMAFLLCLFIGAAGITVDLGHAYACYRELQASTDAAAMAAGYALSQSTATVASVKAAAGSYGSASNGANVNQNLPNTTIATDLNCSTSVANLGILCSSSPTGYNVVRVTQSVVIPTFFMRGFAIFGVQGAKSVSLTAVSTAAARGASASQYNVAVVIDTTASMNTQDNDAACGDTRIHCALQGVQTLLKSLSPCSSNGSGKDCSGGKAFDAVSLFTFPNIQANQASKDTSCPTGNPAIPSYYTPVRGATWSAPSGTSATYQVTSYLSDWSSTGKQNGALNTSSSLGIASGASTASNCKGLQAPGGDGTYYAGAIYAAQSSLMAAQAANPGSQNALVILSDGDAQSTKINVTGTVQKAGTGTPALSVDYPSSSNQCQQAIDAARFASSQGTTVYTIAYGASNAGCSQDKSGPLAGISPCSALQKMATAPGNFFSDANASQNKGQCTSAQNPNLSLDQIFKAVGTSLSFSRLVPNSYYN
ncbi:vWA domain-containing protein [Occallatibacter savannae]|uniref:vWA domain-containing protein n=1 Tax=Occallatibacter savannae TaxID=1002691 RepID=UPI000D68C264|nr:vWA domain-containing protein [Occallatibacter savannae]